MKYLLPVLGLLAGPSAAQDFFVDVPQAVLTTVGDLLPEQSSAGAAFVSGSYSPNLVFDQDATVDVIFVWEGAGYRNTLGWFSFVEETDGSVTVIESNLIIPDASFPPQGSLATGSAYTLRDTFGVARVFTSGERVGFFVVADGWSLEPLVQDFVSGSIPSSDPAINAGFGRGCYTSLDKLNPEYQGGASELARHLAMLWLPAEPGFLDDEAFLLSGFEDLRRDSPGCDNDFNDLVFLVDASPIEAIDQTPAFNFSPGDPDGDGVIGISDHYPSDGDRAFLTRMPANSERVVACEDRYPWIGDADFNDLVLAYHIETVSNAAGGITDLLLTLHLVARGATYEHSVGWHLPGLPASTTGSLSIERFLSDDAGTHQVEPVRTIQQLVTQDKRRIPDLFPLTSVALPPPPGNLLTNTYTGKIDRPAASVRVHLRFDQPIAPAVLGTQPYDLYFSIHHGEELWDVHFPGYPGFPERTGYLPDETSPLSFLDDSGNPWMVELATNWQFPMEQVAIWNAYPSFVPWAESEGEEATDWYAQPELGQGLVSEKLLDYVPSRVWNVGLPQP